MTVRTAKQRSKVQQPLKKTDAVIIMLLSVETTSRKKHALVRPHTRRSLACQNAWERGQKKKKKQKRPAGPKIEHLSMRISCEGATKGFALPQHEEEKRKTEKKDRNNAKPQIEITSVFTNPPTFTVTKSENRCSSTSSHQDSL